jgi:hypothetical protein
MVQMEVLIFEESVRYGEEKRRPDETDGKLGI